MVTAGAQNGGNLGFIGFRVQGSGFRVSGLGFRVQGLGFFGLGVWGLQHGGLWLGFWNSSCDAWGCDTGLGN